MWSIYSLSLKFTLCNLIWVWYFTGIAPENYIDSFHWIIWLLVLYFMHFFSHWFLLLLPRQPFPTGERVTYTGKECLCQRCLHIPVVDSQSPARSPTTAGPSEYTTHLYRMNEWMNECFILRFGSGMSLCPISDVFTNFTHPPQPCQMSRPTA